MSNLIQQTREKLRSAGYKSSIKGGKLVVEIASPRSPYDARVSQFARSVAELYTSGSLESFVKNKANGMSLDYVELRVKKGNTRDYFIRDAVKYIREHKLIKVSPNKGATTSRGYIKYNTTFESKAEYLKFLDNAHRMAIEAISNTFPDGDPIDIIEPKMKKLASLRMGSISEHLDEAFKKNEGTTYAKYLKNLWSDMVNSMSEEHKMSYFGTIDPENPW